MSSDSSLSNDISLAHDPYERAMREERYTKNLIGFNSALKMSRIWNRVKSKMDGAKDNMIQGAIMGFLVGGLFGFAVGCYSAVTTRRFMAIPISTIVSGVSFGFILGCGSMIRAAQLQNLAKESCQLKQGQWQQVLTFNIRNELS